MRPPGYEGVNVCFVEVDGVGYVIFFDVFSEYGSVLSRSWWEDLMQSHVFQDLMEATLRMCFWT